MRPKINVMKKEWKNLEFGGDLNKASILLVFPSASNFQFVSYRVRLATTETPYLSPLTNKSRAEHEEI